MQCFIDLVPLVFELAGGGGGKNDPLRRLHFKKQLNPLRVKAKCLKWSKICSKPFSFQIFRLNLIRGVCESEW